MMHSVAVPYFADVEWYKAWVAWRMGMGAAPKCPSRSLTRTVLSGAGGERMLSVPVAGGARRQRLHPDPMAELSEHGDWRRVHIATVNALYGRTPYFEALMPAVEQALHSCHTRLAEVSVTLHAAVRDTLFPRGVHATARHMQAMDPATLAALRAEWEARVEPRTPMLTALMTHGPQAVFLLAKSLIPHS